MTYLMIFVPAVIAAVIWNFGPGFWPIGNFTVASFAACAVTTLAMLAKTCDAAVAKARCNLLAFCCLWVLLVSSIWPYIEWINNAWVAAQDAQIKGELPAGTRAWSEAVDLYFFWIGRSDFKLVAAIFLSAVALIVIFSSTARASWRTLFPKTRLQAEGPWTAQFMSSASVAALCENATGLPLGTFGQKIIRYRPAPHFGWKATTPFSQVLAAENSCPA